MNSKSTTESENLEQVVQESNLELDSQKSEVIDLFVTPNKKFLSKPVSQQEQE